MRDGMKIESIGLLYFSPTHTTRKLIEGIAQGMKASAVQCYDLTLPCANDEKSHSFVEDVVIIGSPVYSGRLPALVQSRLGKMKGNGRPAVIVVVYGNRAYEDALIELRDVAIEMGFRPIAAGSFIGEHSYSTPDLPIAAGRPDEEDLSAARRFGGAICDKLLSDDSRPAERLGVPGNVPYKEVRSLSGVVPSVNEALCSRCGECARLCPSAAIDKSAPMHTAGDRCIRCCACVKACSRKARALDDPRVRQVAEWLQAQFSSRKEPEIYL